VAPSVVPALNGNPLRADMVWSYPKFTAFRDAQHVFSDLALYADDEVTISGDGEAATLGTYGVISFGVAQRTREIGIRVALGAQRREVVRMIVRQGLALALAGGVTGLLAALAATRMLRSLLFKVVPSDPATYAAIHAVLAAAVLLASWIPARRANRHSPVGRVARRLAIPPEPSVVTAACVMLGLYLPNAWRRNAEGSHDAERTDRADHRLPTVWSRRQRART
jgi:hypothetical protein